MTPTPSLPEDGDVAAWVEKATTILGHEWTKRHPNDFSAELARGVLALAARLQEIEDAAPPTPKEWHAMCDRAEDAEAREAALAARLRALGYNVTAILESDLLATGPGATE